MTIHQSDPKKNARPLEKKNTLRDGELNPGLPCDKR
ncbi:unnamed protein product [Debaryomyces tyrocola]|nr:unnamed protein product [Debaryomyces tyrocola]